MKTMKAIRFLNLMLVLGVGFLASGAAFAAEPSKEAKAPAGQLVPITEKDAAWAAKAKAEYPVTACMVSGDKLEGGDMGKPVDYIYRQEGKPDRLIRFCCKDCPGDFSKDPLKYLKMLDEAAAAKAKAASKN
jgi:hypothetical protein